MKNKSAIFSLIPVLFGFYIMGFCDIIGVSVTYAKEQFNWTETEAGFLPFMVFLWFLILSIPASIVMNKIGRKNTVLISMAFTFAGMIIPLIRFDPFICYTAFALLGIGNTILQVSLNPLLSNIVHGRMLTSSLNTGQFIKAISAFMGPIIAGFCSLKFGSWEIIFPFYAIITLISTIWLYLTSIEKEELILQPPSLRPILNLLKDKKIILLLLGILCIVGLDVGMSIATPKILMERIGLSKELAGYGSSWYFAAKTAGTFCGAFLLAKCSGSSYFRINITITILALAGLFFVDTHFSILFLVIIIAFTASSVFAVLFSTALQEKPENANEISGLMITGVSGGAFIPPLMGICTDLVGNQNGSIIIICVCALYLCFCAFRISHKQ